MRLPRGEVRPQGKQGLRAFQAWIWVFSSTLSTTAFVGGAR
jgi:hypothetical protein